MGFGSIDEVECGACVKESTQGEGVVVVVVVQDEVVFELIVVVMRCAGGGPGVRGRRECVRRVTLMGVYRMLGGDRVLNMLILI